MAVFAFLRFCVVLAMLAAAVVAWPAAAAAESASKVEVMTRNLYVGADLTRVFQATTLPQFVAATAETYRIAQASDPVARMQAVAREIAETDPLIVGLQEVALFEADTTPPTNDGPATPADTTVYDFLDLLLTALAAQGTPYTVVTSATNVSSEVPTALGFDVKLTDHDVLLAKADVAPDKLSWHGARSASFATNLQLSTVAGPLTFTRGYNVADFTVKKRSFRVVNTHLEASSNLIRSAQAGELLRGALADTAATQILVGDINSDPREMGVNPYDLLAGAGFSDSWTEANPGSIGLTCCYGELLLDADASVFDSRIDVVLARNARKDAHRATIVGTDPGNRTPSGRWPSDHAGVSSTLKP